MTSAKPRNVIGWLESQPEFRSLTDRAAHLLALQADLRRCAPARGLTALGVDGDTVLVGTAGAAAAAKLRQVEPTIVAHLAALGWKVRHIRVRPLPVGAVAPRPAAVARGQIPASALEQFRIMSDQASSPALKQALANLLKSRSSGPR